MSDKETKSPTPPEPTIGEFTEGKASVTLPVPEGSLPTSWSDVLPPVSTRSETASPPQDTTPPPAEAPTQKSAE